MKVAVINCGSAKQHKKCKAQDLYIGSLFLASQEFCKSKYDQYCILSAKYHVLLPDDIVEPYDMFLTKFSKKDKEEWSRITAEQLLTKFPEDTEFDFYVSQSYLTYVLPYLDKAKRVYNTYLNDLGMGYKIQWFQQHTTKKLKKLF